MNVLKWLGNMLMPQDLEGDLKRYIDMEYPKEAPYVKAAMVADILTRTRQARPVAIQRVLMADNESVLVPMDPAEAPCDGC